jgi:transcription termination factor Rho
MPKAATKKAARKSAKIIAPKPAADAPDQAPALASSPETPPSPSEMKLEPPTRAVETREGVESPSVSSAPGGGTVNIAELQAMAMPELNQKARGMEIENFGTMRKHELIFQILQKNAERAGVLFSEGVLEILPEGFGFLRSRSFNYLPCPEDIYVSP